MQTNEASGMGAGSTSQHEPKTSGDGNKQTITHNLDTGEDEILDTSDRDDSGNIMDFADGSGGGSATDGGAS